MPTGPVEPENESSSAPKTEQSWLDRVLWLGPQGPAAGTAAWEPGQPGFDFVALARQVCDEAGRIPRTGRGARVVFMLDCIAVELLLRAHLARAGHESVLLTEADWARVQALPCLASAWGKLSSAQREALRTVVGAQPVAATTCLSDEERDAFAQSLRELIRDLNAQFDADAGRLAWAVITRWWRIAVVCALMVVTVGLAAAWVRSLTSRNLAFHCPVSASSLNGYGPDPSRLVDGVTDQIAFHTNGGEQQWVVIDLGEVKQFDQIVVYNRPDCCPERAVPLRVEVSNDDRSYRQIAERREVFDRWVVKNLHTEGRYVRLLNSPPNFFHLAEVEIH